jgi:outer membrane protein assembly factor BamE (lipoprotein component of BamABCDE complex)
MILLSRNLLSLGCVLYDYMLAYIFSGKVQVLYVLGTPVTFIDFVWCYLKLRKSQYTRKGIAVNFDSVKVTLKYRRT